MLYLGYAYRDIEIGTQYIQEVSGYGNIVYEVAGILADNQRFLSQLSDLDISITTETVKLYDDLDYAVIMLHDTVYINRWLFSIQAGKEDQAFKDIAMQAEKYGIPYKIENLQSAFDRVDEQNRGFLAMTRETTVFIIIITLILICSQQIVNFMNRKSEFGVFYSQGMDDTSIRSFLIGETCIRLFIAFPVFGLINYVMMKNIFWGNTQVESVVNELTAKYVYPYILLLALFIGVISVIIPIALISRKTPEELMEEK